MSGRYARQMALPGVGAAGQARLAAAEVLVVGAGGLGCALLSYLAAAGVGRLVVLDHDRVEESNLHRQPLYRMADLGALKVQAARAALLALNPAVAIEAVPERLTPANAPRLIAGAQLVLDAADSFAVAYILSDECLRTGKPLVSASVLGQAGYAGVFCGGAPSYRAVFPDLPVRAGSCDEAGVLGTAVGVLGTLQAHLALAVLLGLTPSVRGRLVTVDLASMRFGGFDFTGTREPTEAPAPFIDASQLEAGDIVIDLRGEAEAPVTVCGAATRGRAEDFEREDPGLAHDRRVVLCCRSGLRAWRAARALQRRGYERLALVAVGR